MASTGAAADKVFSIEGKGLKLNTADDIDGHIEPLTTNFQFEHVKIGGNTLGVRASERLAVALQKQKNLRVVNLADIFTSRLVHEIPIALQAIVSALLTLPHLHTIDLSDNAFGLNTQAPLVDLLSNHIPLQHLILNNNGLGPKAGVLLAESLERLAHKKITVKGPPMKTIVCGRNRLESKSMNAWAKMFKSHNEHAQSLGEEQGKTSGIETIRMSQNGITKDGIVELLGKGLVHAPDLLVLDLQDNTFSVTGARALAKSISKWPRLQELDVGDCLLRPRGGIEVVNGIAYAKLANLHALRMQFNEIDVRSLQVLAETTKHLPSLRRIELNGNRFKESDRALEQLRDELNRRKREQRVQHVDDDEEHGWGIDELDELDDDDDDSGGDETDDGDEEDKEDESSSESDDGGKENKPSPDLGRPRTSPQTIDDSAARVGSTVSGCVKEEMESNKLANEVDKIGRQLGNVNLKG